MLIHVIYVILVSVSNYNFQQWRHPNEVYNPDLQEYVLIPGWDKPHRPRAASALTILVIIFSSYLASKSIRQMRILGLEFFSSFWNISAIIYQSCNIAGSILRLRDGEDTPESRVLLALAVIPTYFNILYYFRAFEQTGPLVSMILRIANDMAPFCVVLFIVLVGYSQAFWLMSFGAPVSSMLA
jgi:surface polysaccharide O-acyltransferase-like enzyme